MTWGQALTGLIVLTVVGAGIAYVVVWLRSHAFWATSRHSIIRGQSSSHDPIVDDGLARSQPSLNNLALRPHGPVGSTLLMLLAVSSTRRPLSALGETAGRWSLSAI
jgi:hypothetical protein